MNRKIYYILLLTLCLVMTVQGQVMTQMDENGQLRQSDQYGNFNPNQRDSTKNKNVEIPRGVWAWTVDRR